MCFIKAQAAGIQCWNKGQDPQALFLTRGHFLELMGIAIYFQPSGDALMESPWAPSLPSSIMRVFDSAAANNLLTSRFIYVAFLSASMMHSVLHIFPTTTTFWATEKS